MTTTTPAYSGTEQFYPHHPHFLSAKCPYGNRYEYTFRAFTGDEPEPKSPEFPDYVPVEERTDEDKARLREWHERDDQIEAAHKLWEQARYYRQITPLVEAALKGRPPVDEALAAMESAWAALDTATVWPVAVKRLLEAQDKARTALARWVDDYAYVLAKAEGSQSYYISEHVADWQGIAAKFNGGQRVDWEVGWYYAGDRHCGASYSHNPLDELDEKIRERRARLEEVARYSGDTASSGG